MDVGAEALKTDLAMKPAKLPRSGGQRHLLHGVRHREGFMIVPFAGIALFAYWALTTGLTLVPANDIGWLALIPHSLTGSSSSRATCCCCWVPICSASPGSAHGPSKP
jgi:hypothetical protein